MKLFRAWESLPEYGVSLFVVKFHGEKKEELLVSHLCLPLFLTLHLTLMIFSSSFMGEMNEAAGQFDQHYD